MRKLAVMSTALAFIGFLTTNCLADSVDQLKAAIKTKIGSYGKIIGQPNTNASGTLGFYFQMTNPALTFPGGNFPIIFLITCTIALPGDANVYFCASSPPSSVGVPPSFPTLFQAGP